MRLASQAHEEEDHIALQLEVTAEFRKVIKGDFVRFEGIGCHEIVEFQNTMVERCHGVELDCTKVNGHRRTEAERPPVLQQTLDTEPELLGF